jgi:hypothetical protein
MATTALRRFQARTIRSLSAAVTRANTAMRDTRSVRSGQLGAGESLVAPIQNTELTRDRPRSVRVVASDHHDPDSGSSAFGDRVARFGPRRVLQADQTE